jgi:hypothetical protein
MPFPNALNFDYRQIPLRIPIFEKLPFSPVFRER